MPQERPKATLPLLFSIVVVDLIGFGIIIPILPYYADSYGASATMVGLLLTGYAAMQFVFAPIWGRLSDRIGRRPVMLVTIAGTSLSLFALGFADSLPLLLLARLAAGCFGANVTVATAYVTDVTSEDERTKWMGMIGASFGVGFTIGPAIGGLLAPYGYAVPMLVAGALAAVNFLLAVAVLREPDRHREREGAEGDRMTVLRDPFVRRLTVIYFLFCAAVTQLEATFAFLMMDRFGYDARQVAAILVLVAVVMVSIQGGAMRRLAARHGEKRLILVGAAIMTLCFALVPDSSPIAVLLIPLVAVGIGRAISQPSLMSVVSMATTTSNRGAVMGTFQSAGHLARVVGPICAGALYDTAHALPYYLASIAMLAVLLMARTLPISAPASPHPRQ